MNEVSARCSARRSRPTRRRLLTLLLRDREGTTAIEFGFVAIPFFLLLFGLIEIGLSLFADQVLNNAVLDAARLIRTGQAHSQGFDSGAFKAKVMESMSGFPVSEDRLSIDVERINSFSGYSPKPLIDDGKITEDTAYNHGEAGDIIIVRALYRWPMVSSLMKTNFADLGSGDRLLVATAVFRNEPFPWTTQKPGS
ncbi:TadE/TadG family type IV pilus assembly protein [Stappia sp. ES.058]|uniref:TadE/TadG family type IV pilus assembly protein n=1 Tax=Stappia sp. ES.058 TaxID=1881061 RepID=UPI00087BCA11|nr:TadE/TadG family type IV pilus assembly protein [Stappia sp. ES.058]SDT88866.1 Flp pilus assembly protein TadG [Stappia sp. ES.058]